MYRAAVIGDYDSIYGFKALGADIFAVRNEEECKAAVKKILSENFGAVFITEQYARLDSIRAMMNVPLPAFLTIPNVQGSSGYAEQQLHSMVEKAAGADVLG